MDEIKPPSRSPNTLSDQEIEGAIEGSFSVKTIREILTKPGVIDQYGWIDPEQFADWFATSLEDMIGEEEFTEQWREAFQANWDWGYDVGDRINEVVT